MDQICLVGGGIMATAILKIGCNQMNWSVENTWVAEPVEEQRSKLAKQGYQVVNSVTQLPTSQIVFLCIKPQDMKQACDQLVLSEVISAQTVFISIAAGIGTSDLAAWLGTKKLIRVMPNTPLLVGAGCTFGYTELDHTGEMARFVSEVFSSCGSFSWVDKESLLDVVTAISGSGPAYAYLLIEAMVTQAEKLGLDSDVARQAVIDTVAGACVTAKNSEDPLKTLRERVTSKGGTTAAALDVFAKQGFVRIVAEAISAAHQRAKELANN